uniref:Predicted protein putative n=1 Tax=Albugo laibachii Nc14 TaxID=890382 RepID=F0W8P1_9STRA|nr:predicted protein putative [Albugo laibachii Nc14]|eukprot:CCA17498.1 predicted protein putative [Albugo laibachii Nc14]
MSNSFFQGSDHIELLSAQGRTSAEKWKCKGRVIKSFDKRIKSNAFHLDGNSDTNMQYPKDTKLGATAVMQRFLLFQILVPFTRSLCIEIGYSDFQKNRRRLIISSAFRDFVQNPLHAQIPLGRKIPRDTWMNLVCDMSYLVINSFDYPEDSVDCFKTVDTISISGTCHLRRVFTMKDAPRPTDLIFGDGKVARHAAIHDLPKQFLFTTTTPSKLHDIPKRKGLGGDGYLVPTEYLLFERANSNQTLSSCLQIKSQTSNNNPTVKHENGARKKTNQNNPSEKSRQPRKQLAVKATKPEISDAKIKSLSIRRASLSKRHSLSEGHRSNQEAHEYSPPMEDFEADSQTVSNKVESVQSSVTELNQSKLPELAVEEQIQFDESPKLLEATRGGLAVSGVQNSLERSPYPMKSTTKLESEELSETLDEDSRLATREHMDLGKAEKRNRIMSEIRSTLEELSCTTSPAKLFTSDPLSAIERLSQNAKQLADIEALPPSPKSIFQAESDIWSETIASEASATKLDLSGRLVSLSKEWFAIEDAHGKQATEPLQKSLGAFAEDRSRCLTSYSLEKIPLYDKETHQICSYLLQNPHLNVDYSVPIASAQSTSPIRAKSANFDDRIASFLVKSLMPNISPALQPGCGVAPIGATSQDYTTGPEQCGSNEENADSNLEKDCTSKDDLKDTDDEEEELSLDLSADLAAFSGSQAHHPSDSELRDENSNCNLAEAALTKSYKATKMETPASTTIADDSNVEADMSFSFDDELHQQINAQSVDGDKQTQYSPLEKLPVFSSDLCSIGQDSEQRITSNKKRLENLLASTDWSAMNQQDGSVSTQSVELVYDPILCCYHDPVDNKYYALK